MWGSSMPEDKLNCVREIRRDQERERSVCVCICVCGGFSTVFLQGRYDMIWSRSKAEDTVIWCDNNTKDI